MTSESVAQLLSRFFQLPTEIRIAIYELLDFPPIENNQCSGLILSCRQAKEECEEVATRKAKAWLATFKHTSLSECEYEIRLLLPLSKPIGSRFKFNTIRELTLVFPGHLFHRDVLYQEFYAIFHYLNPIFGLWLDQLTLHFAGSIADVEDPPDNRMIKKVSGRLFFTLEWGFTYAHDPVGQDRMKENYKYSRYWDVWRPELAFMRKLVVSWHLTKDNTQGESMMALEGVCHKRPTTDCTGSRTHRIMSEDGLLGEKMRESRSRFRPSDGEAHMARPSSEHKRSCLKCFGAWEYRRYMRELPDNDDVRWV